jgi:adenylate cyclase
MATETERKFKVKGEFRHLATSSSEIVQCYLIKDTERSIRIRIAGAAAFLTVKSRPAPGKIARGEWEFSIPVSDAIDMMKLCLPGKIIKTRYYVPSGDHVFEVDVFHDRNEGLLMAEIELRSEDEAFERPEWLGDEVTGDPAWYNSNLAK